MEYKCGCRSDTAAEISNERREVGGWMWEKDVWAWRLPLRRNAGRETGEENMCI